MTNCKACNKPNAVIRSFAQFSNILVTEFYTCSKECALVAFEQEFNKGLNCIKQSLLKHAFNECDCGAVCQIEESGKE